MPTKRAILAELTRAELRINLDHYELTVDDRRVKAQLENALARSRKARIGEILNGLSRNRLKELCRSFGLDDSGRKKADIAERLVGSSTASPPSKSRTAASRRSGGPSPRGVSKPSTQASDPPAEVLSVAQLKQYLWSAADILRGSIDSSDYKNYPAASASATARSRGTRSTMNSSRLRHASRASCPARRCASARSPSVVHTTLNPASG